jgi:hypothetical protein
MYQLKHSSIETVIDSPRLKIYCFSASKEIIKVLVEPKRSLPFSEKPDRILNN